MSIFLYVLGVVGITHIIVDPATIVQPFRTWADKHMPEWFNRLVSCYQCCGFWIGAILAILMFEHTMPWYWEVPILFIAGGGTGSFLSTLAAAGLNWLEANSVIDLSSGPVDKKLDEILKRLK